MNQSQLRQMQGGDRDEASNTKKEIQKLIGMIAALSQFVSPAEKRSLPFFKLHKNGVEFKWTEECEQTLA